MSLWSLVAGLVVIAALVAYVGDIVGRKVGRRHWRLFGLRPRTTALIIAVLTGVLIALLAIAAFFFLASDARKTILEAEKVRQERNQLRQEVTRLDGHVKELESRAARALGENEKLEKELSAKVAALKLAESEIKKLKDEKAQLQNDAEQARKALQEREVELSKVRAEVEELNSERKELENEFDALQENQVNLLGELEKLKQTELQAMLRSKNAQEKSKAAAIALAKAQKKVDEIQGEIKLLENEKQRLLGDVTTLDAERKALEGQKAALQAAYRDLQDELDASRAQIYKLKQDEQRLARERSAMQQGLEVFSKQISQKLKNTVLAEAMWRGGSLDNELRSVLHDAEMQARVEGFRGTLVPENMATADWRYPGIIQARAEGVSTDGKVLLSVRFVPKQKRFGIGQVIALRELPPPREQPERVRGALETLREKAFERLLKAGILPEKVSSANLSGAVIADFQAQISELTSNVVVAVVAADDIWTTETPKLIYQVLFIP